MEENRLETVKRFASIWSNSRYNAGISQEDMAMMMGVSRHTIQNWERGISCPDMLQCIQWFKSLNINPLPYFLSFLYGGFDRTEQNDDIDNELYQLLQSILSPKEKKQFLHVIKSGNFSGLLQLMMADMHLNLKMRVNIAKMIVSDYEMEEAISGKPCDDDIAPELDLLKKSIIKAEYAVINRKNAYTTIDESEWRNN